VDPALIRTGAVKTIFDDGNDTGLLGIVGTCTGTGAFIGVVGGGATVLLYRISIALILALFFIDWKPIVIYNRLDGTITKRDTTYAVLNPLFLYKSKFDMIFVPCNNILKTREFVAEKYVSANNNRTIYRPACGTGILYPIPELLARKKRSVQYNSSTTDPLIAVLHFELPYVPVGPYSNLVLSADQICFSPLTSIVVDVGDPQLIRIGSGAP
jgi:hypothetical protein